MRSPAVRTHSISARALPLLTCLVPLAFLACDLGGTGSGGAGSGGDDRCAEHLGIDTRTLIARSPGMAAQFGGLGDSVFWRVDTTAYLWHDGKVDSFPQEWDGGIQIPGLPSFWRLGFADQKLYYWDGSETRQLEHPLADFVEFYASGNRLVWNEYTDSSEVWHFDGTVLRKLESPYRKNIAVRISPKRLAWLAGNDEALAVMLYENGQVREIAPPANKRGNLVVTDDMVAWVDGGGVVAYRDGALQYLSTALEIDMNTRLAAHGKELIWTLTYIPPYTVYYHDGETTRALEDTAGGTAFRSLRFLFPDVLAEYAGGRGEGRVLFTGSVPANTDLPDRNRVHLSGKRLYSMAAFQTDFIGSGDPCASPSGSRSFIMAEPL